MGDVVRCGKDETNRFFNNFATFYIFQGYYQRKELEETL